MIKNLLSILVLCCVSLPSHADLLETLPAPLDGKAPTSFEQMWAGFDPRKEPLEVEILDEWEEDGVVVVEAPVAVAAPGPARAEQDPMGSTADANPKDDAPAP